MSADVLRVSRVTARTAAAWVATSLIAASLLSALAWAPAVAQAARPPVVLIVLDEFPSADLMTRDGHLDARRYPGFAALARGSTWFPNAYSVHDSTHFAVPAIETGIAPQPGTGPSYLTHPQSIFTLMHRLGYRIHSREEATTVCPPSLCSRADHYGNPHYNILHRRRERIEHTIANLRSTRAPVFTFHHSVIPHVPWVYLPSGQNHEGYAPGTLPDFASPAGFGDPFLTQFNLQRHLLQVGFADREIGRLVRRLKAIGEWRRTLLVVTADQGISFDVGTTDRRMVTPANIHEVAPVPLFVKRPGQVRGKVSSAYATGTDIVPTIADLLHVPLGYSADGSDAFGRRVAQRAGVSMLRRDLSGVITISARQLRARRRADWAQRAAVFGNGPWSRIYRVGPHRQLLGKRIPMRGGSPPHVARFVVPEDLTHVNLQASTVPTMAAGRIDGGSASADRDLALTVDGRVAAVGRSFHLSGDPTEWFTFNVPESALRQGRNSMALYAVKPVDGHLVTSPLGARN